MKVLFEITNLEEEVVKKLDNRNIEDNYEDNLLLLILCLIRLEILNNEKVSGENLVAMIYLTGYSHQFYKHDFPIIHSQVEKVTNMLYDYCLDGNLADILCPHILDRNGWKEFIIRKITTLMRIA